MNPECVSCGKPATTPESLLCEKCFVRGKPGKYDASYNRRIYDEWVRHRDEQRRKFRTPKSGMTNRERRESKSHIWQKGAGWVPNPEYRGGCQDSGGQTLK
jgi:hypothetical protein